MRLDDTLMGWEGRMAQNPGWLEHWKARAKDLNREVMALYFAYRDPRTPWFARAWLLLVLAYAFSPIDMIPDFIPVLGYLDDLLLLPLGVLLAVRLLPAEVLADARLRAAENADAPRPVWMAVVVILVWVVAAALVIALVWSRVGAACLAPPAIN
jgi:uncharacterized membrane protein YkvA (DUF1232 family)